MINLKSGNGNSLDFVKFMIDRFGLRAKRAKGQNRKEVPALTMPESGPINVRRGDRTRVKSDGKED